MRAAVQRPLLLRGRLRLQQQYLLDDFLEQRRFTGGVAFGLAAGHAEKAGEEQHGYSPAISRSAVTLGRKQYAAARVVTKVGNPVILMGGAPSACGIRNTLD